MVVRLRELAARVERPLALERDRELVERELPDRELVEREVPFDRELADRELVEREVPFDREPLDERPVLPDFELRVVRRPEPPLELEPDPPLLACGMFASLEDVR